MKKFKFDELSDSAKSEAISNEIIHMIENDDNLAESLGEMGIPHSMCFQVVFNNNREIILAKLLNKTFNEFGEIV